MIELDIMVDEWGRPEFRVLFDSEECDRVLEDRSVEVVGPIQREVIETDGDVCRNDRSHVQEAFGWRLKRRGLIYPGNNPERVMPYIKWQLQV